jgi:hypothetical protein
MASNERVPIGAEARGKLRLLKAELAKQDKAIENALDDHRTQQAIVQFARRGSTLGRSRALAKLSQAFGRGAFLEGFHIAGHTL